MHGQGRASQYPGTSWDQSYPRAVPAAIFPESEWRAHVPCGITSAVDRGANREQGVEKQISDILQLRIHRVYDLFPPAGDAEVCPLSPVCLPI